MTTQSRTGLKMSASILLSLAWVLLGLALALWSPWLGLAPEAVQALVNYGAPAVTAALILGNLVLAVRLVGRTGRTLHALPLTLAQVLLFALLFYQVACHLGAEHYAWDATPGWGSWLWLAFAHAVRATDLLDLFHAYGIHVQTIRHASILTSATLVAYYFVLNLFLISLLVEYVRRGKKYFRARFLDNTGRSSVPRIVAGGVLLFVLVWLISALALRPWQRRDILLWPVDNLLRVLDFTDALEIFDVRLHQLPATLWEGTLTLVCRLLIAAVLAAILERAALAARLRWLGGFGLGADELQDFLVRHPDSPLREKARGRLRGLLTAGTPRPVIGWVALVGGLAVAAGVSAAWLYHHPGWPHRDQAVARLTAAALDPEHEAAGRALGALRRLGSSAAGEVPTLSRALPELPREHRLLVLDTLGYLGETAGDSLVEWVRAGDEETALRAVHALCVQGPRAAPALADVLSSPREPVRQAARAALLDWGGDAVQPLIDTLGPANAIRRMELLEELDPYWHLRTSGNPYFAQVAETWELIVTVRDGQASPHLLREATQRLGDLGTAAVPAVPFLVEGLTQRESGVRKATSDALTRLGGLAVPALAERLADVGWRGRATAIELLARIGPDAAAAVPALIRCLEDRDGLVRVTAARTLGQVGPGAAAAIPALVERLGEDEAFREAAATTLGRLGPRAADAVPGLVEHLADGDSRVRASVRAALDRIDESWRLSEAARQAVPALSERLADGDRNTRQAAAEALGELGPRAAGALPALARCLADEHALVRTTATEALDRIDPSWRQSEEIRGVVPTLLARLADEEVQARLSAAAALGEIGPGATSAVPALAERLADEHSFVRGTAARALGRIDREWARLEAAQRAIPLLVKRLQDREDEVRSAAATALGHFGPGAASAVPALTERLEDRSWPVRKAAAATLGQVGPKAAAAISGLAGRLEDGYAREEAATALGRIGPAAVPALTAKLAKGDSLARRAAVDALGAIGPDAASAVPTLIASLADGSDDVRSRAAAALEEIDPGWPRSEAARRAIPVLIERLGDRDSLVRLKAAEVLTRLGPPAVSALVERLEDEERDMRRRAAEALGQLGPEAATAVPALASRLEDRESGISEEAATALGLIGPKAASAIPALLERLGDHQKNIRLKVTAALDLIDKDWRQSEAARRAVPALVKLLAAPGWDIRVGAAEGLGALGPPAADAIPALVERLADETAGVRSSAADALQAIDPRWVSSEGAHQAIPTLIKRLGDRDRASRLLAVRVLGQIGPPAAEAVPAIMKQLEIKESSPRRAEDIRKLITEALDRIDPSWRKRQHM